MKPTQNYVVLEMPRFEEKTKSGVLKGEEAIKEEMKILDKLKLKVLAVGPGCVSVSVGDKIAIERHAFTMCTDVDFEGVPSMCLRETSIIGVY